MQQPEGIKAKMRVLPCVIEGGLVGRGARSTVRGSQFAVAFRHTRLTGRHCQIAPEPRRSAVDNRTSDAMQMPFKPDSQPHRLGYLTLSIWRILNIVRKYRS